jgi:hypothetical protein
MYDPPRLSKRSRGRLLLVHLAFGIVLAATLALAFGWVVMLLWNAVLPAVAPVRALTYCQGVALLVLARLLVGGLGHGGHGASRHRHGEAWRKYEKWWDEIGQHSFDEYSRDHQQ